MIFVNNNLDWNRLAIIASRRLGKAHIRNYEKRLCREFFREIKGSLPVGYDFLIIVRERSKSFSESRKNFTELFKKLIFSIKKSEK